ncbi:histidinol-phosphate aminotransferase family protein [Candidatus Daviesbacteria bacterium]|nr:histidinol-phosphate aminotransferase family protein [Candidatus Daviesbacteria bacterium]
MKIPKLYAFNKKLTIDLSLSENPLGCSPRVFNVLKRDVKSVVEYPDPASSLLTSKFAKKFKTSKKQVLVGNGSESLIDLLCRVLLNPKDEVVLPQLTFPLFERAILLAKGKPVFAKMKRNFQIDLQTIKNCVNRQTKLIIICNPNNPTGKVIDRNNLTDFVKDVRPPVLVDEANIEFGGKSVVSAVKNNSNLMVLRTFSKAFGLAGLRIGVLFGPKDLIERFRQFSQPFPLNSFTQKAAISALEDKKFIEKSRLFMDRERMFLTDELRKREFMVFNSEANNILVEVNRIFPSATEFVKLLNKNNVSVINGKSFRGLGDRFIRVSPRTRKTNRQFLRVIDKIIASTLGVE